MMMILNKMNENEDNRPSMKIDGAADDDDIVTLQITTRFFVDIVRWLIVD